MRRGWKKNWSNSCKKFTRNTNLSEILEKVDVCYYFGEWPNHSKNLRVSIFPANSSLFIAAPQPRGTDYGVSSNFTPTIIIEKFGRLCFMVKTNFRILNLFYKWIILIKKINGTIHYKISYWRFFNDHNYSLLHWRINSVTILFKKKSVTKKKHVDMSNPNPMFICSPLLWQFGVHDRTMSFVVIQVFYINIKPNFVGITYKHRTWLIY